MLTQTEQTPLFVLYINFRSLLDQSLLFLRNCLIDIVLFGLLVLVKSLYTRECLSDYDNRLVPALTTLEGGLVLGFLLRSLC
jgi:hypothetical protein